MAKQVAALESATDPVQLKNAVLERKLDVLCDLAARRLKDPAALEEVAIRGVDMAALGIALEGIDDAASLGRISERVAERAVRIAAAVKAKKRTWIEAFHAATRPGSTLADLGDVLAAAVSLFQKVQDSAVEGVQEACLNLIRRGDESRIPEMVELLDRYGNKTLGEDYLNCGQPDLDTAARRWAAVRGYSVSTGNGSHRADWGTWR